jgi:hypothetical protein
MRERLRQTRKLSDRQRVRDLLVRELVMATDLADTLCTAFRRAQRMRITIQVDDIDCSTGILARANEPLMEYFANWAVGEKIRKADRLDEFDKGQAEYERDRLKCLAEVERQLQQANAEVKRLEQVNALGAKSGDQAKNRSTLADDGDL